MDAIVIEHVPVGDLPLAWRTGLTQSDGMRVTVRIEAEAQTAATTAVAEEFVTDDPAFGIWRDRDDMADVEAHIRRVRTPRFNRDGSRNKP